MVLVELRAAQFTGISIRAAHYLYSTLRNIQPIQSVSSEHEDSAERILRSYSSGTTNRTFDLVQE